MNNPADWTSVVAIVAAGLIAGAMFIYFINRPKAIPRRYVVIAVMSLATALGAIAFLASKPKTTSQPAAADDPLRTLESNVLKNPDNLELRNDLARAYVERDNLMGVFEQTKYVLERSPENPRALAYQALVKNAMGESAAAEEMLQQSLAADPTLLDAYVTLAAVQTQSGQTAKAKKTMEEALRRHPQDQQRLRHVFDQMAPASTPSAPSSMKVTISGPARDGVIFVIARPAGEAKGHPVAVKRVEGSSLPATFDFGDADSMMGTPLPSALRIEARLDGDGDVITKNPADPFAFQDNVSGGSAVTLTLR